MVHLQPAHQLHILLLNYSFMNSFWSKNSLRIFQRRLVNLSPRNRSLVLLSLPKEQFLDIHELDFLSGSSSFHLIKGCIAGKSNLPLCEVLDPRDQKVNDISRRLRLIARTASFIEAERGTEDLYLGWPLVQGKFADGTVVRAPLLFWPVSLRVNPQNQWVMDRRDEPLVLNRSLAMAYAHFNGLKVLEEVFEKDFEDFPKDSLHFRTELYEWLKTTPLKLNYNSDLFEDQLQFFPKLLKSDLERTERAGELRLVPHAIIGIFPQAGSYLVRDYESLLQRVEADNFSPFQSEVTDHLSKKIREADILTPFPMDASQEAAFRRVKKGESLVVQGPPGTGKSQLICNLIADFTAQGKRVLVVSQKRAALDTVYDRLSRAHWQDFAANLHDFQHDRKSLYTQITGQIDRIDEYKRLNTSLDAILLDREFTQHSNQIDRIQEELDDFKKALFDTSACGVSAKELYLTSDPHKPRIELQDLYQSFPLHTLEETTQKLKRYESYQSRIGQNHPWQDRQDFSVFTFQDVPAIKSTVLEIPAVIEQITQQIQAFLGRKVSWAEVRSLQKEERALVRLLKEFTPEREIWVRRLHYRQISDWKEWPIRRQIEQLINQGIASESFRSSELRPFLETLETAIQARPSLLKWLFFSEKESLQKQASPYGLTLEHTDLQKLRQIVLNRLEVEWLMQQWAEPLHIRVQQEEWSQTRQNWERVTSQVAEASTQYEHIRKSYSLIGELYRFHSESNQTNFADKISQIIQLLQQLGQKQESWKRYLTASQMDWITQATPQQTSLLLDSLTNDFELLQEFDTLQNQLSPAESEVIKRGAGHELLDTFVNSLKLAWIEHLELKMPLLRSVSGLKMQQMEEDLQQAVLRKQELAGEIGRKQLREQTYQSLEMNRLGKVTTYRDLRHQVTKKRLIWPVRQVLSHFTDEVLTLVPCWLASPETVSAIFPLTEEPFFDLVIFDEASQCFAEQGLPAMFRGKQVVIAGDSKQLQPSDLYRVRLDEDTDDIPELEVTSLLDLMARYLPQVLLQGHYRSRSLDLIEFSNQHFYENRLKLLPDFQEMNRNSGAIHYIKVEGEWKDQQNEPEAAAVVALLQTLTRQEPDLSVGVVTFNSPQQRLLEDKLDITSAQAEPLFIKNLENVQGDERDVIIFSIGYAPNEQGKVSAHFGSLNQIGGENRLNVAITRARQRIYVVTSLWPEQLKVEEAMNEGPRLLKAYLNFARSVSSGEYLPKPLAVQELKSSQLLKDQLERMHPSWVKELPFADLVKKEKTVYEGLILTDDDLYYQSLSSKEAHAYFPMSLQRKGWPYRRIWSRQWWKNRAAD